MKPWEIRRERNVAKKIQREKDKEVITTLELLLEAEYNASDRHFYYKKPTPGQGSIHRRHVFPKRTEQ